MHALPWSDVIIRDVETMQPVENRKKGLINVINPCAYSYAGVSILQDDMARIVADDGCPCGRCGKYIEVIGRTQGAEAKGSWGVNCRNDKKVKIDFPFKLNAIFFLIHFIVVYWK